MNTFPLCHANFPSRAPIVHCLLSTILYRAIAHSVVCPEDLIRLFGGLDGFFDAFGGPSIYIRRSLVGDMRTGDLVGVLADRPDLLWATIFDREWPDDDRHRAFLLTVLETFVETRVLDDELRSTRAAILEVVGPAASEGLDPHTYDLAELVNSAPMTTLLRIPRAIGEREGWEPSLQRACEEQRIADAVDGNDLSAFEAAIGYEHAKPPPLPPREPTFVDEVVILEDETVTAADDPDDELDALLRKLRIDGPTL